MIQRVIRTAERKNFAGVRDFFYFRCREKMAPRGAQNDRASSYVSDTTTPLDRRFWVSIDVESQPNFRTPKTPNTTTAREILSNIYVRQRRREMQ